MFPVKYDFSKLDSLSDGIKLKMIQVHNSIFLELENLLDKLDINSTSHKELYNSLSLFKTLKIKTDLDYKDLNNYQYTLMLLKREDINSIKSKIKISQFYYNKKNHNLLDRDEYKILDDISKKEYIKVKKYIESILNYDNHRQIFYEILRTQNIRVCVYCLAQHAIIYESTDKKKKSKGWKATVQLDHLHPKSIYPFLSLSIYNLFLVCAHCNNRKGKQTVNYNPLASTEIYKWNLDNMFEFKNGKLLYRKNGSIAITRSKILNNDLVKLLDYQNLYNQFDFVVENFIQRINKYDSEGYRQSINQLFKKKDKLEEEKLKYFIADSSLKEDDIFKYPLTKLKIELYKNIKKSMETK